MSKLRPRNIAFKILLRVSRDRAFADKLLQSETARLEPEKAAFITRLVKTCLEHEREIDAQLKKLSSQPLVKLQLELLTALRLGSCQILFFKNVENSLAVSSSVSISKKELGEGAGKFCNAVLRNLIRKQKDLPKSSSHPKWLVEGWNDSYGAKVAELICKANDSDAVTYLRHNALGCSKEELLSSLKSEGFNCETVSISKSAVRIVSNEKQRRLHETEAYKKGYFYIQDLSATLVIELLPKGSGRSVDLCSAPGGKVTHLFEQETGPQIACDLHLGKLRLLGESLKRLGHKDIWRCCCDAAMLPFPEQSFGRVLLDAPCSGSGVIGRKVELRHRISPAGIKEMTKLQKMLLDHATKYVQPGGQLIYSTCSIEAEENQLQAEQFLNRNSNFRPLALEACPSEIRLNESQVLILPQQLRSSGAFVAGFQRVSR